MAPFIQKILSIYHVQGIFLYTRHIGVYKTEPYPYWAFILLGEANNNKEIYKIMQNGDKCYIEK